MLISAAPIAIPVSTANVPTESVASEAARKPAIPESQSTSDHSSTRNSTDSNEQLRNTVNSNNDARREDVADDSSGRESSEQSNQERQEQQRQQAQESREVQKLKRIDREVRVHEAAHASVGGQFAGAPQLSFTTGPDGKQYAVAGEVSIDTSRVPDDPRATINKMNQVRQAALAPADPSSQDLKVAAIASQIANQASAELNSLRNEEAAERDSAENSERGLSSDRDDNLRTGRGSFINPVSARRSSQALNQKIIESGAFHDADRDSFLSQTA